MDIIVYPGSPCIIRREAKKLSISHKQIDWEGDVCPGEGYSENQEIQQRGETKAWMWGMGGSPFGMQVGIKLGGHCGAQSSL